MQNSPPGKTALRPIRDNAGNPMTIEAAALRLGGEIYSVPRPGRHSDVNRYMVSLGIAHSDISRAEQGFLTNSGEFMSRWRARRIAERAGQCEAGHSLERELTSDDVW